MAAVRFQRLEDWLEWQQSLHPNAIDLGLERVARVLHRTGWRGADASVITVGGTNGKGSCVALLEAMFTAGGYRVGAFTSPHLVDYRERIRLQKRPVSPASLVASFERIADSLGGDSLTFFEFNTLAALLVFETWRPDLILLEVGLGGRLDAVNVVDPDVAVVVTVALDHTEWLGPDVESIGREKAGIFRRARPAVCGMTDPPASLVSAASELGARLLVRGRDFDGVQLAGGRWRYRDARGELDELPPAALEGRAQYENAATAVAAARQLSDRRPLSRGAIAAGLCEVRLRGRFQRIAGAGGIEWILDVAHNPEAAATLAENLQRHPAQGRTIAVCGMLGDKDVASVLETLRGCVEEWFAAATDGPRALGDAALAARAAAIGIRMTPAGAVPAAMAAAAARARPGDRIVVFGSFHTVGPALACV